MRASFVSRPLPSCSNPYFLASRAGPSLFPIFETRHKQPVVDRETVFQQVDHPYFLITGAYSAATRTNCLPVFSP